MALQSYIVRLKQVANVQVNNLSRAIAAELQRYSKMVKEEVEEAKQKTAKELKSAIQTDSPEATGDYKKGWRVKKNSANKSFIVHNATDYQLTHLLENGYAKRNGGRQQGRAHIRPNEEKAIDKYLERIERAVKE
jgi:hypothetical protein